jgi:hypothetical protein
MDEPRSDFQTRLRTLGRKQRLMERSGGSIVVREDGLIVVQPRSGAGARGLFPVKGLAVTLICFFAFKGFLLSAHGDAQYEERLIKLAAGTTVEQIGAQVMQPDAVSLMFAKAFNDVRF